MFPALLPIDYLATEPALQTRLLPEKHKDGIVSLWPQAGTGGRMDILFWESRLTFGYPGPVTIYVKQANTLRPKSATDQIDLIRQTLKPSVLSLAKVFGVTRQTLYNWMRGDKQPGTENQYKLDDLANAAQVLADVGIAGRTISRRNIRDGKNLLELAQAGEPMADATHQLVTIIQKEAAQRARLEARLAKRRHAAAPSDLPGTPMLDD